MAPDTLLNTILGNSSVSRTADVQELAELLAPDWPVLSHQSRTEGPVALQNGSLPDSSLDSVPGGELSNDAAAAYWICIEQHAVMVSHCGRQDLTPPFDG